MSTNDPLLNLATSVGVNLTVLRFAFVHLAKTLDAKGIIDAEAFSASLEASAKLLPSGTLNEQDIAKGIYAIAQGIRSAESAPAPTQQ